jgi:hypothetical protein
VLIKDVTLLSQGNTAGCAIEQLDIQPLFQRADLAANLWYRNRQPFRGPGEALRFGYMNKLTDAFPLHDCYREVKVNCIIVQLFAVWKLI